MASSKYQDISSTIQVIGNVFNKPELLDQTDKYILNEEDFPNEFHRIVFGVIYKLYHLGANKINLENILDFLSNRPEYEAIYLKNKGNEWLSAASSTANLDSFDLYYNRLKKMSLLRAYDKYGVDVSFLFDPDNILDIRKKQEQQDWLDNSSLEDIADRIDKMIDDIKISYVGNNYGHSFEAGDGIVDLIMNLKESPEVGVPLYGKYINTVHRGARLGKFYLRSGATGTGKSRTLIADSCYVACNSIYEDGEWIEKSSYPTLFIATEQDLQEVQTMLLAFVANVNEEHILYGKYDYGEEDRVYKAAEIIKNSPLYIETIPDFSLQDIENIIKKNVRERGVRFIFYDYIHVSMKILEEITRRSGGVKLREDNVLFMLSNRLKDLCNQYHIFIESSTQLNGTYVDAETPDQNLLRGAKSIADKIDVGSIMLTTTSEDIEGLTSLLAKNNFDRPDIKLSIYKNRRGKYKGIYLWCKNNLGTCRINPMFATDYMYNVIDLPDLQIKIDEGAF